MCFNVHVVANRHLLILMENYKDRKRVSVFQDTNIGCKLK